MIEFALSQMHASGNPKTSPYRILPMIVHLDNTKRMEIIREIKRIKDERGL